MFDKILERLERCTRFNDRATGEIAALRKIQASEGVSQTLHASHHLVGFVIVEFDVVFVCEKIGIR